MAVRQTERSKSGGDRVGRSEPVPANVRARSTPSAVRPGRNGTTRAEAGERNCSVARTLDIVSDAWSFLVIREAFFETRTFERFRASLGISRATLTDRLRKLTRLGIFRKVRADIGHRSEYRLTQKGFDLYPSFV